MDMAIVNPAMLEIYEDVPPDLLELVEDVLFARAAGATERLLGYAQTRESGPRAEAKALAWRDAPVAERLRHALVRGVSDYIEEDAEAARLDAELPAGGHRGTADGRHERGG